MLRKLSDLPARPCLHPEHDPPSMIVLEPGVYEHTCPSCGQSVTFTVDRPYMTAVPPICQVRRCYGHTLYYFQSDGRVIERWTDGWPDTGDTTFKIDA